MFLKCTGRKPKNSVTFYPVVLPLFLKQSEQGEEPLPRSREALPERYSQSVVGNLGPQWVRVFEQSGFPLVIGLSSSAQRPSCSKSPETYTAFTNPL